MDAVIGIDPALAAVRELYACWARGDIERMERLVTDDFLWAEHPAAPDAGIHRGRSAWAASRRAYADVWQSIAIVPFRYLVSARRILAVVRYELRGHGGVPITGNSGHLVELRGGAIASLAMLGKDEALARLGPDAARLHANAKAVRELHAVRESAARHDRVAAALHDGSALLAELREGRVVRCAVQRDYDAALAGL